MNNDLYFCCKNTTNTLHKIFAKPSILGKKVIFMTECHSTNDFLAEMARKNQEKEGVVLFADYQTKGKGQRGNIWFSEKGKNILMSILLRPTFLPPAKQYLMNLVAALAVSDTLDIYLPFKRNEIKWPNDIYVGEKKICGILVEGNLKGKQMDFSVMGIGLNLNQQGFGMSNATSVFLENDEKIDREIFIEDLVFNIEKWYLELVNNGQDTILSTYLERMMWRGELRKFEDEKSVFSGEIIGIDDSGKLVIQTSQKIKKYDVKEVKFLG